MIKINISKYHFRTKNQAILSTFDETNENDRPDILTITCIIFIAIDITTEGSAIF